MINALMEWVYFVTMITSVVQCYKNALKIIIPKCSFIIKPYDISQDNKTCYLHIISRLVTGNVGIELQGDMNIPTLKKCVLL